MRNLLLTVYCLFGCFAFVQGAAPLTVKVDKRVELLSIACRLADYEEYSNPKNQLYVADISAHFEPYKNHPLIECLRQLKKENGIGYDAIAFMAVSIGQPPAFDPIIPFSEKPIPDSRWSAESATKCVALLQQFYDDAHCAEFFDTQKQRYEFYERQIAKIYLHNVDLAWMERWFGTCENARYNIIVAPGNGTHCYGPKYTDTRGVTDYYAITGLFTDKELDSAAFSIDTPYLIPLIVHEFSHSFVNTVVDRNLHRLGKYADQIVRRSPETDTYNHGETLLYESLVRWFTKTSKPITQAKKPSNANRIGIPRRDFPGYSNWSTTSTSTNSTGTSTRLSNRSQKNSRNSTNGWQKTCNGKSARPL